MKTELALLLQYESPTMTLEEVAEILQLTPRSLENQHYAKRCPIPLFKMGNKLQAHISDVAAYIDGQRAEALREREAANDQRAA
jgi:hypothetical protein